MSVDTHLLVSGFEATTLIPRYRNLWLCDAKWFDLMRYHVRKLKDIEGLTLSVFIRAINRHYKNTMDIFTAENTTGVFHMSFNMRCPIQETRRRVHFYYVAKKGTTVNRPTEVGLKFTHNHPQTIVPLGPPLSRRTTIAATSTATTSMTTTVTAATSDESQPSKRARVEPLLESDSDPYYWKSPEAAKLFLGIDGSLKRVKSKQTDHGEDTFDSVDIEQTMADRIIVLKSVQQENDGWKKIVYTHDVHDACSPSDVFILRQKSLFLSRAYELALDKMPFATWNDCCQQAIDELSVFGFILATNSRTIATWNQSFRKLALFPHPNPLIASGLSVEHPVFAKFPEGKEQADCFCPGESGDSFG